MTILDFYKKQLCQIKMKFPKIYWIREVNRKVSDTNFIDYETVLKQK